MTSVLSMLLAAVVSLGSPQQWVRRAGHEVGGERPGAMGHDPQVIFAHTSRALYRVDLSTGQPSVQLVGSFGAQITDIAQFGDGRLFAISFSDLYLVDQQTGRATLLRSLGSRSLNGLAAWGTRLVASGTDGMFYDVDVTTGAARPVGPFGQRIVSSGDLAFDDSGQLYMTAPTGPRAQGPDLLVRVNVTSGAAQVVGTVGVPHVYGLAFRGQELLGLSDRGEILRIDRNTGASQVIGQTGRAWWGGC